MIREMKIDYIFPTKEVAPDVKNISILVKAAEKLNFNGLVTYDHIVLEKKPSGNNGYTVDDQFHEPMTFFGLLSGLTSKINLISGVLVLPQRQAVLIAKQAALIQNYSDGRLVLGVGVGNVESELEFRAFSQNFSKRGEYMEEQIEVIKLLWQNRLVTFDGKYHQLTEQGINPRPKKQIPIWLGGWSADKVLDRIARLADGWLPMRDVEQIESLIGLLRQKFDFHKRDFTDFPIMGAFGKSGVTIDWCLFMDIVKRLEKIGVSHVAFGTQAFGFGADVDKHIELMSKFTEVFNNRA